MSMDDIRLKPLTIASLYKNSLVELEQNSTPGLKKPAEPFYKFLGDNRKHILLVTNEKEFAYLSDPQMTFLTRMLDACKLNIGDTAIVNHAQKQALQNELKEQFQPQVMILFGVKPVSIELPVQFPEFRIQSFDGCRYLSAPALASLLQENEEGKLLKSKLWICLKDLFNV